MVHVWQFCSNFANFCCHHGDPFGAGGGAAVAGAVGASPKYYEPNSGSSYVLHAIATVCAMSTYPCGTWWTIAGSSIYDGRFLAAAATTATAVAATWHKSFLAD